MDPKNELISFIMYALYILVVLAMIRMVIIYVLIMSGAMIVNIWLVGEPDMPEKRKYFLAKSAVKN